MIQIHLHPTHQKGVVGFPNPHTQHHPIPKKPHDPLGLTSRRSSAGPERDPAGAWSPAGRSLASLLGSCILYYYFFSNLVSNSREGLVPGQYLKEVLLNLSTLCDKDDHSFIHQAFSECLLCSRPRAGTGDNTQRAYDSHPALYGICSLVRESDAEP